MTFWGDLQQSDPDLAEFGFARLHGHVAYLATSRFDGRPRLHPVTPIIGGGHLFLFMEPTSPKGHDLRRGSAYTLHSSVSDTSGSSGEFHASGYGRLVEDPATRRLAIEAAAYEPEERYVLFELSVQEAFSTVYVDGDPKRRRWQRGV